MDERDGVEWSEQQFQHRQSKVKKNKSELKQETNMSKTESRFKSKLESLKKFQHSASTNSAVEKARAFFRSLELKHLGGSSEHSSSSSSRRRAPTTNHKISSKISQPSSISSSSSSSIIDDNHPTMSTTTTTTNESLLGERKPSNHIATARIIRVIQSNYNNSNDMIVLQQDEQQFPSSYPKTIPKKHLPTPKQYFNGRNQGYSFEQHRNTQTDYDSRPLSPVSALNSNVTYLPRRCSPSTHVTLTNGNMSNHQMSTSLYTYRPLVCREMESSPGLMSSSLHERTTEPIIRPLPSSSSMSTWTHSVRRLNSEYLSTINALQQAKESLTQICPDSTDTISKYAHYVARGINDLSNSEPKKSLGVTFCLTGPISHETVSLSSSASSSQLSKSSMKTPPSSVFCKPKLVRPVELDSFTPSIPPIPKLESVPPPKDEKIDSIAEIIKKFNNLNTSTLKSPISLDNQRETPPKTTIDDSIQLKSDQSTSSSRVHFEPSIPTYQLEEIPYESPPPPLTSSSSSSLASEDSTRSTSTSDENFPEQLNNHLQEETTYTIETFYKSSKKDLNKNSSANQQQVVIIRENTTEEQFNLAGENPTDLSEHKFTINESKIPPLTTPLLTYLHLTAKQTTPTPPTREKIHDNSYHSVEPSSHITNDLISDIYHDQDDETISDVVTINPYTHSPPSQHLIDSSSSSTSSSTNSSAATVLLSNNTTTTHSNSSTTTPLSPTPNGSFNKNNKSVSQLPKRTITNNNSRLKQPLKLTSPSSKLKPPSSAFGKPIKSMIGNSTSTAVVTTTSPIRKSTGITTHSIGNKTSQQQLPSSTLSNGKKQQLVNGTETTESSHSTDSSISHGKNRVRSMVNQLNAAVSSSTTASVKRIPVSVTSNVNTRRLPPAEPTMNKTSITSPSRPSLQRAMTINNQSSVTSSPPSTLPTMNNNNNTSSAYKRKTPLIRSTSNVKEGLLRWCQAQVADYPNVSVTNLSSSWSDGLAFCALIHHFFPDAFDFNSLSSINRKDNFELAFHTAEERAGVPRLLDVSDMLLMGNTPDYKCIFTYLNSFLARVKDLHPPSNGH